jgi:hypothetical protein
MSTEGSGTFAQGGREALARHADHEQHAKLTFAGLKADEMLAETQSRKTTLSQESRRFYVWIEC